MSDYSPGSTTPLWIVSRVFVITWSDLKGLISRRYMMISDVLTLRVMEGYKLQCTRISAVLPLPSMQVQRTAGRASSIAQTSVYIAFPIFSSQLHRCPHDNYEHGSHPPIPSSLLPPSVPSDSFTQIVPALWTLVFTSTLELKTLCLYECSTSGCSCSKDPGGVQQARWGCVINFGGG
ncbi:hypothetical protein BDQ17DRAFT_1546284 [Cyathus striatus]|nr:hypothetical protein BDQ17DRAFT_1546284 [Cyathus striatus]